MGVLVLLGVYAYSKPCLSKHDDKMLTISQGSTFVVLLTVLMAKNSEGMPEGVIVVLLYLSTFLPLCACLYILGSDYAQHKRKQEVAKALAALQDAGHGIGEGELHGTAETDTDSRRL